MSKKERGNEEKVSNERVGTQRKEKWAPPRTPVELQQLQNIPFLRFNDAECFFTGPPLKLCQIT